MIMLHGNTKLHIQIYVILLPTSLFYLVANSSAKIAS